MTDASPSHLPPSDLASAPRLRADMASRKLIVLGFVTRYLSDHPGSPSYGEIARGCGISRSAAKRIVRRLEIDEKLVRGHGARRGIMLPSTRDAALAQLRAAGYVVDEDARRIAIPGTKTTLPRVPELSDSARMGRDTGGASGGFDDRHQSGRSAGHARDHRPLSPSGARRTPRRAGGG
ncbi:MULTISPECIES: Lrp/AsnC family transcriptional regulator [Sphingomonas]|uniref:Lrp/AsnC family transcriptional regulator n=1 Tax=Sphingomonas TaxID=13687 RepID=UPI000829E353|nr:Lrp/AsnC family transcriptional regulator [Sphingomonas sp. CCH10-B3]